MLHQGQSSQFFNLVNFIGNQIKKTKQIKNKNTEVDDQKNAEYIYYM